MTKANKATSQMMLSLSQSVGSGRSSWSALASTLIKAVLFVRPNELINWKRMRRQLAIGWRSFKFFLLLLGPSWKSRRWEWASSFSHGRTRRDGMGGRRETFHFCHILLFNLARLRNLIKELAKREGKLIRLPYWTTGQRVSEPRSRRRSVSRLLEM